MKKEIQKQVLLWTAVFYFVTHGYRSVNTLFSGDSLLMIHQDDYAWQIAIGRCFQPIWLMVRGCIVSPWLITILGFVWIGATVLFTVDLLNIKRKEEIALTAAIMCTNTTLTCLNATFLPWLDMCAFALFLATFGVWLLLKEQMLARLLGVLAIILSLGTYQSYICVAAALLLMVFLQNLMQKYTVAMLWKKWKWVLIGVLSGGMIYFVCWKGMQRIFHIWTSNSYNGLDSLGDFSNQPIGALFAGAYARVFDFLWEPARFVTLYFRGISMNILWVYAIRLVHVLLLGIVLLRIIVLGKEKKEKWWRLLLQLICVFMFPLAINAVYVISKGMEHTLMVYAFSYVYLLVLIVMTSEKKKTIWNYLVWGLIGMVVWSNIVFANQIYIKKTLQEQAAVSLAGRVVQDIEGMQNYIPGKTPVAFVGNFDDSPLVGDVIGFKDLELYGTSRSAMFYEGTEYALIRYYLNVNMNLTRVDRDDEEIVKLSVYPDKGSMQYVGDTLVIKISE